MVVKASVLSLCISSLPVPLDIDPATHRICEWVCASRCAHVSGGRSGDRAAIPAHTTRVLLDTYFDESDRWWTAPGGLGNFNQLIFSCCNGDHTVLAGATGGTVSR